MLDINDYGHSGRVWHDEATEKYYYKGGQLCEIDMVDFASSYICDNEAYELNFKWCEIDEEISVYVDESMSADVAIEAIAGNTGVVLVSRILPQEGQTDFQLCDLKSQTFQIVRNCGKQSEEDVPPPWLIHNMDKRDVYWSDGKLRQEYIEKLEYEGVAGSEEAKLEYTDLHIIDDSTVEVYSLPECTYIMVKKVSYNNSDSYYTYILYETNGQEVNFTEAENDEIYQYIDLDNERETSKN